MKSIRRFLKPAAEAALLIFFLWLLIAIFQGLIPFNPKNVASTGVPVESQAATAYPLPITSPSPPVPSPTRPRINAPTLPPTWTPYPTNTARPGPTDTPIPLSAPADTAAGVIWYFSIDANKDKAISNLEVDAQGKLKQKLSKTSLASFQDAHLLDVANIYPSPNGQKFALVGPWGVGAIYTISTGKYEPFLNNLDRFHSWFPDNYHLLTGSKALFLTDPFSRDFIPLFIDAYKTVLSAAASPDGTSIVYSYTAKGSSGIRIVDAHGRNMRQLLGNFGRDFSWSPDGKSIAYWGGGFKVMKVDGTNLRNLNGDITHPRCYFHPPIWSPDSRMLAIVSGGDYCYSQWADAIYQKSVIWLFDVESGKGLELLADGGGGSLDPAWSPDGSQLAFISRRSGSPEVWIVNRDGSGLRQLTTQGEQIRFLFWRKP